MGEDPAHANQVMNTESSPRDLAKTKQEIQLHSNSDL